MSRFYEFHLKHGNRYSQDAVIALPSVTSIIGTVLAKPALVPWTYRTTVDAISHAIGEILSGVTSAEALSDFSETFSDPEDLDAWIRKSGIHPDDFSRAAMKRGEKAHAALADLAIVHNSGGANEAFTMAATLMKNAKEPYIRSVARWWNERTPVPVLSEHVVVSLEHRYAGRFDLLAEVAGELVLLDLKTRRAGLGAYESDQLQLGLYSLALVEGTDHRPVKRVVLLAHEDESYKEVECSLPAKAGLPLVEIYYALRGRKR